MSNEATLVDTVGLANELRPVVLKITRELRREVHAIGVSASQVSLLVQIRASSGIGISELAERERMSVSASSRPGSSSAPAPRAATAAASG